MVVLFSWWSLGGHQFPNLNHPKTILNSHSLYLDFWKTWQISMCLSCNDTMWALGKPPEEVVMTEQWSMRALKVVFGIFLLSRKELPSSAKFPELLQFSREAYGKHDLLFNDVPSAHSMLLCTSSNRGLEITFSGFCVLFCGLFLWGNDVNTSRRVDFQGWSGDWHQVEHRDYVNVFKLSSLAKFVTILLNSFSVLSLPPPQ